MPHLEFTPQRLFGVIVPFVPAGGLGLGDWLLPGVVSEAAVIVIIVTLVYSFHSS